MTNRLKEMGLTLSAAFKKTWKLVKVQTIETNVAGITKSNRQNALYRIATKYSPEAVKVKLERDKANLYNNNAVKVIISVNDLESYDLGCIPHNITYVTSLIDNGIELTAVFKKIRGHYLPFMNYGVIIALSMA